MFESHNMPRVVPGDILLCFVRKMLFNFLSIFQAFGMLIIGKCIKGNKLLLLLCHVLRGLQFC